MCVKLESSFISQCYLSRTDVRDGWNFKQSNNEVRFQFSSEDSCSEIANDTDGDAYEEWTVEERNLE